MAFVKLSLGPTDVVLGTVTKRTVTVSLGPAALRAVGWSESEPNLAAAVGDGEDAGWVRLFVDEDGSTPVETGGRVEVSLPRSAVPDLEACRSSPLVWRPVDGGIDVRLPTVGRPGTAPRLRAVPGGRAPATSAEPSEDLPLATAPPPLYAQLHRDAWAAGIEVHFLSNGDVVVNGRAVSVDDVEREVRRVAERRSTDVARAGAA